MLSPRYTGCIYLATNRINGRAYIGKTVLKLFSRKAVHVSSAMRKHGTSVFHRAIRKHGKEAFVWSKLFESNDEALLFEAEVSLIADFRAAGASLYNMSTGGEGQSLPCSDKRRAAASAAMKGRTLSVEHRANLSMAARGKAKSPEHVAKMRATKTGATVAPWSDERRAKCAATWAKKTAEGYGHSEETRRKQSEAALRRLDREGERERLREVANKGRKTRWGS